MAKQPRLTREAQEIEGHLRAIRQILRRPVEAEFARGNLTGPQRSVMQALFHADGLSLKELSGHVGLAHSTVSGIVDRLEKRGMAERRPNPADGRASIIVVSNRVRDYMRDTLPAIVLHPVTAALGRAKPAERAAILAGLRTLRRVVEATARS
jgi:DNA-binding MarR family transcriptional regulator